MSRHIALAITAALATACIDPAASGCSECSIAAQVDTGYEEEVRAEVDADAPTNPYQMTDEVPEVIDGWMYVSVRHPTTCDAPDLDLTVFGVGRSLPATALGAMVLHSETQCAHDAEQTVSTVGASLEWALAEFGCVGRVAMATPEGELLTVELETQVCGEAAPL